MPVTPTPSTVPLLAALVDVSLLGRDGGEMQHVPGAKPAIRGDRAGVERRAIPLQRAGAVEHDGAAARRGPAPISSVPPASMVEPPV